MEKVVGIGGLLFRSREPKALAKWCEDSLGVSIVPSTYDESLWHQQAWMVNFRVRNLEALVAQLNAAGIPVELWEPAHGNDASR